LGQGDPPAADPLIASAVKRPQDVKYVEVRNALAAGTTLVSVSKTRFVFAATLALNQENLGLYCHDGPWTEQWIGSAYDEIAWFQIRRGLRFRILTVQTKAGEGRYICRLGEQMAANARYVLTAKGVPSK
jgi:hypothetical protein